jgi:hypothetical protein
MTVRTAISHPWRPETIEGIVSHYDAECPSMEAARWQVRHTKVHVPPGPLNPSECNSCMSIYSSPQWNSSGADRALTLKTPVIVLRGLCNAQSRPVARDVFGIARQSVPLALDNSHILFVGRT